MRKKPLIITVAVIAILLGVLAIPYAKKMYYREASDSSSAAKLSSPDAPAQSKPAVSNAAKSERDLRRSEAVFSDSRAATQASATSLSACLDRIQSQVMNGRYGKAPIEDVVKALREISGGPDIQDVFMALCVRKKEALPLIKEKMKTGDIQEKQMITKLLRYSPWAETYPELIEMATAQDTHYLSRTGALYALGAMDRASAGPEIEKILIEPGCPPMVQQVAISALARIGDKEAASAIQSFQQTENIHTRLFANWALGQLGASVDRPFLLQSLDSQDYTVREEGIQALGALEDPQVQDRLSALASDDPNQSVRSAARQALLEKKIQGKLDGDKATILEGALSSPERKLTPWIIQTLIQRCGSEGIQRVAQLSQRDDYVGDRARALLVWHSAAKQ
ncbi:MAG: HEAT repeat domain-containing protein [Candidatus Sumerlaeota bacterium]|nr:HEAT repeat domain-containing protein [Candidatus Sumerlaeota bacterium]